MRPLFIIGMPRSGTKLLREILNRHDDISIPRAETGFIPYFYQHRADFGDLNRRSNFHRFFIEFRKTNFCHYIDNAADIWDEAGLYDSTPDHRLPAVLEAIFRMHADFEGKMFWGDKTPEYLYHTTLIKELFPDARFVHIIRDVRDFCLSSRTAWHKNAYRAAQKWTDAIELVRRQTRDIAEDYYEINYEALIDNPAHQARRLCRWLGIDFCAAMVDLPQTVENLGDNRNQPGILTGNYRKWKGKFRPEQIRKIESIAGRMLAALGYPLEYPLRSRRLAYPEMLAYALFDISNLFIFRTREYRSMRMAARRLLRDLKHKAL